MRLFIFALLCITTLYSGVKVGDAFPVFHLKDQFGNPVTVPQKGKMVLWLSFEKGVSSEIKTFLDTKPKGYMPKHHIMYISDISPMPSFVTKLFALPKMKKFDFKIALIDEDHIADVIPRKEERVTRIVLDNNKIVKIDYLRAKNLDK
jgi:hypothetical protein